MPSPNMSKLNVPLSPEVKAFGVPFISVVVLALLVIFAILPLWNKVTSKQTQLSNAQEELKRLTEKEEKLKQLDSGLLETQFQVAEIALPSGKEVPALLVGISKLYNEQGMTLTNLKITPGKVSTESATPQTGGQAQTPPSSAAQTGSGSNSFPSNKRLDFDIVLTGSLEQTRGFLENLEKSLRLMVVNSFSFTKSTTGSSQVSLRISAPFDPFPPIPTNFAESLPNLTASDQEILKKLSSYTPLTTPFSNSSAVGGQANPFNTSPSTPVPSVTLAPSPTQTPASTRSSSLLE